MYCIYTSILKLKLLKRLIKTQKHSYEGILMCFKNYLSLTNIHPTKQKLLYKVQIKYKNLY